MVMPAIFQPATDVLADCTASLRACFAAQEFLLPRAYKSLDSLNRLVLSSRESLNHSRCLMNPSASQKNEHILQHK